MRLSDAIRKGCEQHPQSFGRLFEFRGYDVVASCAMGAALMGVYGAEGYALNTSNLEKEFPLLKRIAHSPVSGTVYHRLPFSLADQIITLNDHHKWTRERIADWVETIEEELDGPQVATTEGTEAADKA